MSSSAEIRSVGPDDIRVSGDLNFTSVLGLRYQGELLIAEAPGSLSVDFSGVNSSGSAAVSLMMCWLRTARAQGKTVRFTGVPELLQRIIAVSGLAEHLLPVSSENA